MVLFIRGLQKEAAEAGGMVIVTPGNHEAKLAESGYRKYSSAAKYDIKHHDINKKDLEKSNDFMDQLPIAQLIGNALLLHAGNVNLKAMQRITDAEASRGYYSLEAMTRDVNKAVLGPDSLLDAKKWIKRKKDRDRIRKKGKKMGVKCVLFGHMPYAFGVKGQATTSDGFFIKMDSGIGNGRKPTFVYCKDAALLSENGGLACSIMDSDRNIKPLPIVKK